MKTYWPLAVIALVLLAALSVSQYEEHAKRAYEKHHPQIAASVGKDDNHQPGGDPNQPYQPPILAKYFTFPEGIGAWAVVLTLLAIVWQSIETKKAADAALYQLKAATNRDRARIIAAADGIQVMRGIGSFPDEFWYMQAEVRLRNVGISRAYVYKGAGEFKIRLSRESPKTDFTKTKASLAVVHDFVEPNTPINAPRAESLIFPEFVLSLEEQSELIFPGTTVPYLTGFIEYETVGVNFRKHFHYSWRSRGVNGEKDFQMYRALHGMYPNTPASPQEKIAAGYWAEEESGNEDYEIGPPSAPNLFQKLINWMEELARESIGD